MFYLQYVAHQSHSSCLPSSVSAVRAAAVYGGSPTVHFPNVGKQQKVHALRWDLTLQELVSIRCVYSWPELQLWFYYEMHIDVLDLMQLSLCECVWTESQLSAVDALIESMMLVEQDEDGESVDIFKVNDIPNPQFQRLFQAWWEWDGHPDNIWFSHSSQIDSICLM